MFGLSRLATHPIALGLAGFATTALLLWINAGVAIA
jgi:hypothetical protein